MSIREQALSLARKHIALAERAKNLCSYDWHLRQSGIWMGVYRRAQV